MVFVVRQCLMAVSFASAALASQPCKHDLDEMRWGGSNRYIC
jgi:hypothetical protein